MSEYTKCSEVMEGANVFYTAASEKIQMIRPSKNTVTLLLAGLCITLAASCLFIWSPFYLERLNLAVYDQLLTRFHSTETSGVPVIVDLDERSLKTYGQWPWPRWRVALLLGKIRNAGAAAVGLDILFAEPDRTSPAVLQRELKQGLGVENEFAGLPAGLEDNDRVLAGTLAQGPFVLGYLFTFSGTDKGTGGELHPVSPAVLKEAGGMQGDLPFVRASGVDAPLQILLDSAPGSGFFNTLSDADGLLRRIPLLVARGDRLYPSLALATLRMALGDPPLVLKIGKNGPQSLRLGPTLIPLDREGWMALHYRGGREAFQVVSAADILEDKVGRDVLAGKIVFAGSSVPSLMDLRSTPLARVYPGTQAHATAVDTILKGDFISRPGWTVGAELVMLVFVGMVLTVLITWSRTRLVFPVAIAVGGVVLGVSVWCFAGPGVFLSPVMAEVVLILQLLLLSLIKYRQEEQARQFMHGALCRYVSSGVAEEILRRPEALTLTGEEKTISVLFSDIRGFTTLSEKLSPTQVSSLLKDYFTPMTGIVIDRSGTLDKFIGDALLAFWNAPVDVPGHQALALDAAMEMLEKVRALNTYFQKEYGVAVAIGIGLHSGAVRVGNMGSEDLFDYTVIGDGVNLASRLEGLCKFYGVTLVVSESVVEAADGPWSFQVLDKVRVKGKSEPVRIFTVLAREAAEDRGAERQRYDQAMTRYLDGDFLTAGDEFQELAEDFPETLLYTVYAGRCRALFETPPALPWDGVFSHTSK